MHEWLHRLDQHFPVRYTAWMLSGAGLLVSSFTLLTQGQGGMAALACLFLVGLC